MRECNFQNMLTKSKSLVWKNLEVRNKTKKLDRGVKVERVWITTQEVLDYVGIGRATLYKLMKSGGFPRPAKIGHQNKWNRHLVDQFLIDSMPLPPKTKK